MAVLIYWFRQDLRLSDNPAFVQACLHSDCLLPVYIHQTQDRVSDPWETKRAGQHRLSFLQASLKDLKIQLQSLGSDLFEFEGKPEDVLIELAKTLAAKAIYCEKIQAPEEIIQVLKLQKSGIKVESIWQSSMLDTETLPFELKAMPDMFTQFRQAVEKQKLKFAHPVATPQSMPPLPSQTASLAVKQIDSIESASNLFQGGESHGMAHLNQYLQRRLPDTYKETRNQLMGMDYSSKFSPWLANGCISARVIASNIAAYERQYGANDGTYWLWFELMWRDYFRFIHFKYGSRLYQAKGLSNLPVNPFDASKFRQWCTGNTGVALVDAAMRELKVTGYLSNRMRQVVASYWIYDMQGDWRAGAAWFESQLIDYDVYSNQGNWLYIAGSGTDPRGGRRFNVAKQTQDHDPEGIYRRLWIKAYEQ